VEAALPDVARYAVAAALAAGLVWGAGTGRFFQLRAAEWRFPVEAVRFLREHGIRGPLFNTYEYGGYLIWQGEPVFIDGRALSEQVFQDYRVILGSPPGDAARGQTLERYGVTAMVVNGFEYNSGTLYPLVTGADVARRDGWHLIYEDAQALIFVRDLPAGVAALPAGRVDTHLENECRLHVETRSGILLVRAHAGRFVYAGGRQRAGAALAEGITWTIHMATTRRRSGHGCSSSSDSGSLAIGRGPAPLCDKIEVTVRSHLVRVHLKRVLFIPILACTFVAQTAPLAMVVLNTGDGTAGACRRAGRSR
jgi:hypothetical protein